MLLHTYFIYVYILPKPWICIHSSKYIHTLIEVFRIQRDNCGFSPVAHPICQVAIVKTRSYRPHVQDLTNHLIPNPTSCPRRNHGDGQFIYWQANKRTSTVFLAINVVALARRRHCPDPSSWSVGNGGVALGNVVGDICLVPPSVSFALDFDNIGVCKGSAGAK